MKQQAISILDEMIKTLDTIYCDSSEGWEVRWLYDAMKWILWEAKSRIQAIDGWNEMISKKLALDFADWYHNWLLNSERRDVEEEFKKFCIVKFTPV